jgi:hypothetical protein
MTPLGWQANGQENGHAGTIAVSHFGLPTTDCQETFSGVIFEDGLKMVLIGFRII